MGRESSLSFVEWKHEGQKIAGTVVDIRKGRKFPGRQTYVAEIETKQGAVALVLTRLLEAKLRALRVKRGDRVRIEFLGDRESKTGRMYHEFEVVKVQRP